MAELVTDRTEPNIFSLGYSRMGPATVSAIDDTGDSVWRVSAASR
jgi:hypothetical protein